MQSGGDPAQTLDAFEKLVGWHGFVLGAIVVVELRKRIRHKPVSALEAGQCER
jgi:hypothetical protein